VLYCDQPGKNVLLSASSLSKHSKTQFTSNITQDILTTLTATKTTASMPSTLDKITAKLSDHPNASSDPNINPTSGTQDVNQGNDPDKTDVENWIQKGQGVGGLHGDSKPPIRAGSLTSDDTTAPATGMLEKKT